MAKCNRCGKKGLFLKVNEVGLCKECESLVKFEHEESQLTQNVNSLKTELADEQKLYDTIAEKAKTEALQDITSEIDKKKCELDDISQNAEKKTTELADVEAQVEKANKSLNSAVNKAQKIKNLYKSMEYAIAHYTDQDAAAAGFVIPNVVEELDAQLEPTVILKLHCMDIKQLRSLYNQNAKQIQETLAKYQGRYTTKANIAIYRLMVIALEAELQNVLYNIGFGKLDKATDDIKAMTAKYLKIATDGNQQIAPTMVKFIGEIEYLFLEAIKIEYEYYVKKEQIKEEQRAIREQMRQEAEERHQLEQQRKQVEKEESKYTAEIENVTNQLQNTEDEEKIQQLQERIARLHEQLGDVEKKKEDIINLQNGQAGYVYIISNLGSFGDDVFKVGMTRRLEPQERIDELGSASVPFSFDVHSFIFSENAVALENNLHKQLNQKRLNKVNMRKEFFKTNIDELEQLVYDLEPSAEFNRTMLAEQYNQSLSIVDNLDEIIDIPGDTTEDDDNLEDEE